MKKYILFFVAFSFALATFAQQKKELKHNEETNLIEATYYHENGTISQEGTFDLAGKLHGEWVSFDETGDKISLGHYNKGVKTGNWLFWDNDKVKEVSFNNNVIASVIDKESKSKVVTKD